MPLTEPFVRVYEPAPVNLPSSLSTAYGTLRSIGSEFFLVSTSQISPLLSFNDVLKLKKEYDLALIPWELERETSLKTALAPVLQNYGTTILLLIGPEGGFSQKEVDAAVKAGFTPVSLGPRILRTETAGLSILSMLNYQFEL